MDFLTTDRGSNSKFSQFLLASGREKDIMINLYYKKLNPFIGLSK